MLLKMRERLRRWRCKQFGHDWRVHWCLAEPYLRCLRCGTGADICGDEIEAIAPGQEPPK